MKHVTIDSDAAPPDAPSAPYLGFSSNYSLSAAQEPPAEDGECRSPTSERFDVESVHTEQHRFRRVSNVSTHSSHHPLTQTKTQTQTSHHVHYSKKVFSQPLINGSVVGLGERLLEKLHWRERLRHFTWSFFTMTMATGGIANVIYEGAFLGEMTHRHGLLD